MARKVELKPFLRARNEFLPSLENFVNKAMNLYHAVDILTSDSLGVVSPDFPGKDALRKRVEEFRATCMADDED